MLCVRVLPIVKYFEQCRNDSIVKIWDYNRLNPSTQWWSAFTTKISDPWCKISNILNITYERLIERIDFVTHWPHVHPSPCRTPCRCWSAPSSTLALARTRPGSAAPARSAGRPSTCRPCAASTRYEWRNLFVRWKKPTGCTVETG